MRRISKGLQRPICGTIDNYNASVHHESSYVIAGAYREGGF